MANVQTNGNGQIQKREASGVAKQREEHPLISLLSSKGMQAQIAAALPKHVTAERMARVALTALRTTRDLDKCTTPSFLACVMQAAQLGLEVNTPLGHSWLIPRKAKGLKPDQRECTLMIGYQGLIDLARRSGQVLGIWAFPVYQGDAFKVAYGLHPSVEHEPRFEAARIASKGQNNTLRYVYAAARLRDNDDPVFVVLTWSEVDGYRKRGASGQGFSTPWDTDYEAMALKTAVRRLYRWLPKSIEMARAQAMDEASELGLGQTFDPVISDTIERGGGLELTEGMPAETLDTADVPESAQHAQHIDQSGRPGSSPGTTRSYDPSEQDAPPHDDE